MRNSTLPLRLPLAAAAIASFAFLGCGRDRAPAADAGASRAADWRSYNGGLDGQRYSALDQVTTQNVATLAPTCEVKMGEVGAFQAGPLVLGDTLVVTTTRTTAALNATNCALIWRDVDTLKGNSVFPVNRGAAALDGKIFRGTPDGRLFALDLRTGKRLWDVQVGDPKVGEFISSAPIAWNGHVFVGLAGGDWGIRGRVMAFDPQTGKEQWRFYTIPVGNEPGAETWKIPETAKRGGGGTWTSYTLDSTAAELFVPVGNPSPDFAPQSRPGDNLYTNGVVVLDAGTGALKWHYQLTPNDGFDWDLGAPPMLYDAGDGARVAVASKDGHLYAIDRGSHELKFKVPVTTILNADSAPTPKGIKACPGPLGGTEWNGPAYDPQRKLIYVGAVDWCATYTTTTKEPEYTPGQVYMGTAYAPPGDDPKGWLTAVDARTGAVKWKFQAPQPIVAGVTPTAGGVVFNGDLAGNFYAFDAATGKPLLTRNLGGAIAGGVVTYMVSGKQYVAVPVGNVSRTTFKTTGTPTLVIMTLGASGAPKALELPAVETPTSSVGGESSPAAKPGSGK